jgi:hypothetical protein
VNERKPLVSGSVSGGGGGGPRAAPGRGGLVHRALLEWEPDRDARGAGGAGRGLHSFPFQLDLSCSVHPIAQLHVGAQLELLRDTFLK